MRWLVSGSGDPRALAVVDGTGRWASHGPHYSRRNPGSRTFTGVGREVVLLLEDGSAVWACVQSRTPARRRPSGLLDRALGCRGMTVADIQALHGLSRPGAANWLVLAHAHPAIHRAIRAGEISAWRGTELGRLPGDEQVAALAASPGYVERTLFRNVVFRNLGSSLSSSLISAATERTYSVWRERYGRLPEARLRTEVDVRRVRSTNPGYCYLCAGWTRDKIHARHKLHLYAPETT